MENAYNIKNNHNHIYIFSTRNTQPQEFNAAIILYLYYEDKLDEYYKYIKCIPLQIDTYIISSKQKVIDIISAWNEKGIRRKLFYIKKDNIGRDISALLVTAQDLIRNYKYVCFLHDKKEHVLREKADTDLWVENIWGNLCGSDSQIGQILDLFEKDERIGVLAPPDPIGDNFCTWYGYGWHGSFKATKSLAMQMNLQSPIEKEYPPITIGTALWFRTKALTKLFEFGWKYDDFDDDRLKDPNYFCYGVERIFAYVAQDAGFETGEVMTLEYAKKQTLILKKSTMDIFKSMQEYYPFPIPKQTRFLKRNLNRMKEYAILKRKVYLYGCGDWGRFCAGYLRREGIEPYSFVVSGNTYFGMVDNIKVCNVKELKKESGIGVIITVFSEEAKEEMCRRIQEIGLSDYHIFWKEE